MTVVFFSIILVIVVVWLAIITFSLQKIKNNYAFLTKGSSKKTVDEVLRGILGEQHETKKDIAKLSSRCDTIEKNELLHIQKIGLLRFNPFKDTGGDQSFILSLVDAHGTGIIITALYSRSGTRWYAKKVIEGKGAEHELSEEEKKALKMAKGID